MQLRTYIALAVVAAIAAACAAGSKMPSPKSADQARAPEPFADLEVLESSPFVGANFVHYGVNPTISTRSKASLQFPGHNDTASFAVCIAQLDEGQLPDPASVRPEAFVNAVASPGPDKPSRTWQSAAELVKSPYRPGFAVAHVTVTAPTPVSRRALNTVFVVDVSSHMGARLKRAKTWLARVLEAKQTSDRFAIVAFADDAHVVKSLDDLTVRGGDANVGAGLTAAISAARHTRPNSDTRVVLISSGAWRTHAPAFERAVRRLPRRLDLRVIGAGLHNYDDDMLVHLARRTAGRYDHLSQPPAPESVWSAIIARNARWSLGFDAALVHRYRLVGFNSSKGPGAAEGGTMYAGDTWTAVVELQLGAESEAAIGQFELRFRNADDRSDKVSVAVAGRAVDFSAAGDSTRRALIAAALAEKLRQSYWARKIDYDALAEHAGLLTTDSLESQSLLQAISRSRRLDHRPDRFEAEHPIAQMGFDHVPGAGP